MNFAVSSDGVHYSTVLRVFRFENNLYERGHLAFYDNPHDFYIEHSLDIKEIYLWEGVSTWR